MCQDLKCDHNPDLYYTRQFANRFNLSFPSPRQPEQPTQAQIQAPDYLSGEQSLVLQKIASFLPTADLIQFSQVNRRMAKQTKQEREQRKLETFSPITSLTEIDYGILSPTHKRLFQQCQILPNCLKLRCVYNQLTRLPSLPVCQSLWCSNNQLTQLPELPVCRDLKCDLNRLRQLPALPVCQSQGVIAIN